MKGFPGNIGELMEHAQKLQQNMSQLQADLEKREVEAGAGGGMVQVKVNGQQMVTSLTIDPSVLESGDINMLQDLVRAAVNEGMRRSKDMFKTELSKLTGGLPIPGL